MRRIGSALVGLLSIVVAAAALLAGPASAAPTGAISVWVTPNLTSAGGGGGTVLFTGAIADYGTSKGATSSGATTKSQNPNYELLVLRRGTILVNVTQLNQSANGLQPTVNTSNCSFSGSSSAPVQIVSGTGAYSGIAGTVNLTQTFAAIVPKKSDGSCNENANPKRGAAFATITGTGTVG